MHPEDYVARGHRWHLIVTSWLRRHGTYARMLQMMGVNTSQPAAAEECDEAFWAKYPPEVREWANLSEDDVKKAAWASRAAAPGVEVLRAKITREEAERIRKLPLEEAARERRRIALEQRAARESGNVS